MTACDREKQLFTVDFSGDDHVHRSGESATHPIEPRCSARINGSPIVSMMSKGIDVTSLTMQLALVQAGMGVAVLSALAASHPQAIDLGFTLLEPTIERSVFLMQRTDRPGSPAVAALAQIFLRDLHHVDLRLEVKLP